MKIILFIVSFSLITIDATAMLCDPDPIGKLYRESDVVIEAVVINRDRTEEIDPEWKDICWNYSEWKPNCGPKIAHFKIKETYKGSLKKLSSIYSEDACYCLGSYLTEGETYIIFGQLAEPEKPYDLIATPGCTGITPTKYLPIRDRNEIQELSERN